MISKIGKNESDFVEKLIEFNCVFAKSKQYCTAKNWMAERITYRTSIEDENIYNLFLLWIQNKLIKKKYNEIEIYDFLENDMKTIVKKGIEKKSILDSKERNFSYVDVVCFTLSIIGWLLIPFMLYNHFKIKKYNEIAEALFKELNDNMSHAENKDKVFKVFDKYYEMF